MQAVTLEATFYSDQEYAGIIGQDARGLWKVNVFASPDGTQRLAQTSGTLAPNNENYPLPSGGNLKLNNIEATLDFTTSNNYVTCNDMRYVCVELLRGDNPVPNFSLFGCPTSRLVACARYDCNGEFNSCSR